MFWVHCLLCLLSRERFCLALLDLLLSSLLVLHGGFDDDTEMNMEANA